MRKHITYVFEIDRCDDGAVFAANGCSVSIG